MKNSFLLLYFIIMFNIGFSQPNIKFEELSNIEWETEYDFKFSTENNDYLTNSWFRPGNKIPSTMKLIQFEKEQIGFISFGQKDSDKKTVFFMSLDGNKIFIYFSKENFENNYPNKILEIIKCNNNELVTFENEMRTSLNGTVAPSDRIEVSFFKKSY